MIINKLFFKIQKIGKAEIVTIFSFTALSTLVKMLTGFISVKVVSVIIGPVGIALLGQLNNFSNIIMTVASGGINNGITKYVAQYKESPNKVKLFLSTALQVTIILSTIIGLVLIIFSRCFSRHILLSPKYSYVFILFGFTLTLYTLNGYLMSVLNGYKEFKRFVKISIFSSIIGVFFTVGLVRIWQLKGALISAVTFQSVIFFVTLILVKKTTWFNFGNFSVRFSKLVFKKYLSYSIMSIVTAATVPISQLFIRSYVINHLSATEAGWWEGINRISGMYLMVITSSFSVYYLPKLAEIKDKIELRKEILTAYKVIIPLLTFSFILIYLFRDYTIQLLFSSEFNPMRNLFAWQLMGDLFKISSWLLAFLMIAKSMTKTFILTELFFSTLFVGLSILFLTRQNLVGITQAYAINYFLYFVFMIIFFKNIIFYNKEEK